MYHKYYLNYHLNDNLREGRKRFFDCVLLLINVFFHKMTFNFLTID